MQIRSVCLAVVITLAWAAPVTAQERAGGVGEGLASTPISWQALENQITETQGAVAEVVGVVQRLFTCNAAGSTYAPGNPRADGATGCVNPLSAMDIQVISNNICERWENKPIQSYTATATCPSGYTLLGCSGGEGDMDEIAEGATVQPNGANGCKLVVGQPACVAAEDWTKSWVFAHCGKLSIE